MTGSSISPGQSIASSRRTASDPRNLAIGVFDSGLGGLTVLREMAAQLPFESFLYFGDTARVPYGTKSPETIRRFSREAAHFLLERGVKMIVVACNTATAHALDMLKAESPVPVLGVIDAGARAAHDASRKGKVGVIGTPGTIRSGAYDRATRMLRPHVEIFAQACPLFVPLVEEGWAEHGATEMIAQEYLAPLREVDIDTLILGCTHYPLLRPVIGRIMGPEVKLIDCGAETAREAASMLEKADLLALPGSEPGHRFTVSDLPLRFQTVGRQFIGDLIGVVEQVHVDGRFDLAAPLGAAAGQR